MKRIRRLIYRVGFRPKPGSIFFSPSIAFREVAGKAFTDACEAMRKSYEEKS